jgi:hypothetical protein
LLARLLKDSPLVEVIEEGLDQVEWSPTFESFSQNTLLAAQMSRMSGAVGDRGGGCASARLIWLDSASQQGSLLS